MPSTHKPFRAVIVGGGPVGLVAAHMFSRAGIDYTVLESRDTCTPEEGASLVINPTGMRVFHQLGLAEQARAIAADMDHYQCVTWDGQKYKDGRPVAIFDVTFGQRPLAFHRREVLQLLYDNLADADRARLHTNKKVVDIETHPDGVVVRCADGSVHEGSIVIGADGVHSKTRGLMRKLALEASADTAVNEDKPYTAYYRCLWGTVPIQQGCAPGDSMDCHGPTYSSMFVTGREKAWFFIYELLDNPTNERMDYDAGDMEAYAQRVADMHVGPGIVFSDIWVQRSSAGMSNLDEGILEHWAWDRIVLVGDAVHKTTPNAGWGFNAGIQDMVALTNCLHKLILNRNDDDDDYNPDTREMASVFREYHEARRENMRQAFNWSALLTRKCARDDRTWAGWLYWLVECAGSQIPNFERYMFRYHRVKMIKAGRVLDFVYSDEPFKGVVSWTYPIQSASKE